ncbi:TetR family transcriptional regulator [Endozoicomonas sp.]|uniref:TetR family transcriptional regulator n=1 Tax=Endozoicomonas sp. TaxID=1892382 RepID=UPI00383B9FA0
MNVATSPVPRQARSIKTVEAILDAAARILADKAYEGLNTNTVAAEASVNRQT